MNFHNGFNVEVETVLHNRHLALQRSELHEYVPSSTSSLYNEYVPEYKPVENPHKFMNDNKLNITFNPNTFNLANNYFNNATRNELLNIKIN